MLSVILYSRGAWLSKQKPLAIGNSQLAEIDKHIFAFDLFDNKIDAMSRKVSAQVGDRSMVRVFMQHMGVHFNKSEALRGEIRAVVKWLTRSRDNEAQLCEALQVDPRLQSLDR